MKKFISTIIFMMIISTLFDCRQTEDLEDFKTSKLNTSVSVNESHTALKVTKKSSDSIMVTKNLVAETSAGDPPTKDPFKW